MSVAEKARMTDKEIQERLDKVRYKKGTLVKAWDNNPDNYVVGFIISIQMELSYSYVLRSGTNPEYSSYIGRFKNAEPLHLLPELPAEIGDRCYFYDYGDEESVKYQLVDAYYSYLNEKIRYVDEAGEEWDCIEPITEEEYVLPLKELVQALLDNGYLPDKCGNWAIGEDHFDSCRFKFAGEYVSDTGMEWPAWATETK